jgi:hypothetical protein
MRIKITKNLVLGVQDSNLENDSGDQFPVGEYLANLTPEGKIELVNTKRIKALFSFSQFREKISLGEFIVLEA